ncbi:MAG: HTH domain-containing protein [Alistipes sp.]|nr:HTH domain-containing protein [Alistipes sp.]
MDQPKIERLLRLMKMLTANTTLSVDEMAERLGMSRRTIYRYIDTFREAGFVIKKSGDHIRIDKESPHFKDISQLVHFTEEEAIILKRAIENIDEGNLLKQNLKRKLYSVYENRTLADTIVKGGNAANIHSLIEAIEDRTCVVLHNYRSSHTGSTSDRTVEPFAFTTNYVQVWCFDTSDNTNKLFSTSRIGRVEQLDRKWEHAEEHRIGYTDVFRISGQRRHRIALEMGVMAHNLLIEEFPLAERDVEPCGDNRWRLSTDIADMKGAGRFVIGLLNDIRIVESEELKTYVREYIAMYGTI